MWLVNTVIWALENHSSIRDLQRAIDLRLKQSHRKQTEWLWRGFLLAGGDISRHVGDPEMCHYLRLFNPTPIIVCFLFVSRWEQSSISAMCIHNFQMGLYFNGGNEHILLERQILWLILMNLFPSLLRTEIKLQLQWMNPVTDSSFLPRDTASADAALSEELLQPPLRKHMT